jgi:hypothetical protein
MGDVSAKAAGGLRRHWKAVLWIIGAPSVLDIIKEWGRGRIVEWLVAHLGSLGRWLAENPVAFFTVGLFSGMLFLAISVVRIELNPPASVIVDANHRPYISPPRFIEAVFIVSVIIVFLGLAVYGALKYWAITNTPSVVVTIGKLPSNAAQATAASDEGVQTIPGAKPTKHQNDIIKTYPREKNKNPQKQPTNVVPSTVAPPPYQPAATSFPSAPASAPGSIIPADPEKAVEAINAMRNALMEVLGKKNTITFLISWPDDDSSNLAFISQILRNP